MLDRMYSLVNAVEEATMGQINRKQKTITSLFPTFPARVKGVASKGGVRLDDIELGLWKFKVHSGTDPNLWYDCPMHFKELENKITELVRDKRLWTKDKSRIDLRKLAGEVLNKIDLQVSCSCPAFLYFGQDFILSKDKYDAKFGRPERRPPRVRNPRQYGALCKHLHALFKTIPFYRSTMARYLTNFYGDLIKDMEAEARKEREEFKAAGKELGKRAEERIRRIREEKGKGLQAILKVYRDVERGLDPREDDLDEGLSVFLDYLEMMNKGYREDPEALSYWASTEKQAEETRKRYSNREKEVENALRSSVSAGEKLIALDNVVDLVHHDYPALEHFLWSKEAKENPKLKGLVFGIVKLLRRFGKFPEGFAGVDKPVFAVYKFVGDRTKLAKEFSSKEEAAAYVKDREGYFFSKEYHGEETEERIIERNTFRVLSHDSFGNLKVLSSSGKTYEYDDVSPYHLNKLEQWIKHKQWGTAWQFLRGRERVEEEVDIKDVCESLMI